MRESGFEFGVTPFYFLRHGETHESRTGIVQGQNESELNPDGRQMAEDAAYDLTNVPLRSIYASPLKRAWRTASIVSVLSGGVPVYSRPGLMERHWGKFQGRRKTLRPALADPPTVETMEKFKLRVIAAMESIPGPSPVLVVAHSGVFRALCEGVGIPVNSRVRVLSGQVLKMEPPTESRTAWRITVV